MISIREAFGRSLVELGHKDERIVVISCDLKNATKTSYFFESFPDRSFEVGIAEANAIGIAAGLSLSGFKPIISSFGSFLTGKNLEIRVSVAYNEAPVILVGTHGGLIGPDGATQSSIQDISVMRSIPKIKVFQPSTPIMTQKILRYSTLIDDPVYIRISRNEVPEIYDDNTDFIEGEPICIGKKSDIVIFSSGPILHSCLTASIELEKKHNLKTTVIDIPSIRPLNHQKIKQIVKGKRAIFTFEDHVIEGGMGSAILECISSEESNPRIFLNGLNEFTVSATPNELELKYKLDPDSIIEKIIHSVE